MDVTRYNFTQVLTELEKVLKNASFVSIDGEFTGLNAGENTNPLDTPSEYYKKIRAGALDFLLVQFGLAVFNYDDMTKKYTHRAYNFYIFPRPSIRSAPDSRFLSQASSLDFLAKNKFNFNKLFLEGISYLNQHDEDELRRKLEERRKERKCFNTSPVGESNSIPIPDEHKMVVESACDKISEFLQDKTKDEITLDSCNGFVRKLIYQEAWKKFSPNDLILETKQYQIVARRTTTEDREKLELEKIEKEDSELNEAVGFTHLIRMLSDSNVLIVGHNMLLDLCHVLQRFCMPLPEDYVEFKEMLHCLFPKILDTKYLCSKPDIKEKVPSSVLNQILTTIAEPPFHLVSVEPASEGYGYSLQDDKAHEAGYDAFITGVVFITLSNYLGTLQSPPKNEVLPTSPILKKFINKLFLMKISDTHMNLEGHDPEVNRDHVFHITFPKEWTYQELNQLFNPFSSIYITWLTDTTALVSLNNKEQTLSVVRNLVRNKKNKPKGVTVLTYHAYCTLMQKSNNTNKLSCYNTSPSIQVAKKRKILDTQYSKSPKRRRTDNNRANSSKRSIELIPEEDETLEDLNSSNNTVNTSSKNDSITVKTRSSTEQLFQENEDWN